MSERQKRIESIREAVARDSANLEAAYADRAWLLSELDAVQHHRASLQRAAQGPLVTGLGLDTEGACRAVLDDQIADGSLWALAEVHPAAIVRVLIRMVQEKILALSEEQRRVAELEKLVYVPGSWKCAKCGFGLMSMKLHVNVGAVSANNEPQQCANGCGPMWRVTERDAGNDLCDQIDKMHGYLRDVCEALGMAAFPMPQAREEMLRRARLAPYVELCEQRFAKIQEVADFEGDDPEMELMGRLETIFEICNQRGSGGARPTQVEPQARPDDPASRSNPVTEIGKGTTRYVWIPEAPGHSGLYANESDDWHPGKINLGGRQPSTHDPNKAKQFATRKECDAWCRAHPHPVFEPREHGFIAPPVPRGCGRCDDTGVVPSGDPEFSLEPCPECDGKRLRIDKDWLRRKIDEVGDPPACPACGAMAGACKDYPNCPGGGSSPGVGDGS